LPIARSNNATAQQNPGISLAPPALSWPGEFEESFADGRLREKLSRCCNAYSLLTQTKVVNPVSKLRATLTRRRTLGLAAEAAQASRDMSGS